MGKEHLLPATHLPGWKVERRDSWKPPGAIRRLGSLGAVIHFLEQTGARGTLSQARLTHDKVGCCASGALALARRNFATTALAKSMTADILKDACGVA